MLFDEKDLNVFNTVDARTYFKEIIQSYYSQNYRATIVLLYSFVIYDLFIKLQTMASEGDGKAKNKLKEINDMIADDEKYSKVENEIITFYKENYSLYFNRFVEDINYLKDCRNKCAHLKVNDNSLYVPSDYHARMLICSMYDNILSVKAPFIMDLFSIARNDVEYYSSNVSYIPSAGLDRTIIEKLDSKYFSRMTYDSIKKSYKTFIKLLFVTDNEDCEKNVYGLYTFAYALTDYIIRKEHIRIFNEDIIIGVISKISIEVLKESSNRRNALISIMTNFAKIMDLVSKHKDLFEYVTECVFNTPANISMYRMFFPRSKKSVYTFF